MVHLFASVCSEVSCGKVPVVHGAVPSRSNPARLSTATKAALQIWYRT